MCLTQESDGEKSDDNLVVDVSNEVQKSLTAPDSKKKKPKNPPDSYLCLCSLTIGAIIS